MPVAAFRRSSRMGGRLTDPNPAACRTGLHPYRLAVHIAEAPGLVAHAHQKHRLARVLEDVDNALVAVFKINGLAVGDQMEVGGALQHLGQPPAHLFLEEAEHAPDLLQGKSLAAEFGDDGDLNDLGWEVHPPVPFVPRRDDLALIPPLQLPQAHDCDNGDFSGGISSVGRGGFGTALANFEHIAILGTTFRLYST